MCCTLHNAHHLAQTDLLGFTGPFLWENNTVFEHQSVVKDCILLMRSQKNTGNVN